MAGGKRGHQSDNTKAEDKKPKVDDKAYQEALKRIPDSREKYDPWAVTKTPDADKSSKKSAMKSYARVGLPIRAW